MDEDMRDCRVRTVYWSVRGMDAFLEASYAFNSKRPLDRTYQYTVAPFYGDVGRYTLGLGALFRPATSIAICRRVAEVFTSNPAGWPFRVEEGDFLEHELGINSECLTGKYKPTDFHDLRVHFGPPDRRTRMQWFLRDRLAYELDATRHFRRHFSRREVPDARELRARELVRQVLGEKQYKRYLRTGVAPVRAASGKVYWLSNGQWHMPVFENGKEVEQVCIIPADSGWCQSDVFLMRYTLLVCDEEEFCRIANHHPPHREDGATLTTARLRIVLDTEDPFRPLTDIYRQMATRPRLALEQIHSTSAAEELYQCRPLERMTPR